MGSTVKKYEWKDDKGHIFSSGGILFYDDNGIWVIEELLQNKIKYNDIGGKYNYEDCNIFATICRELREETYNVCDLPYDKMISLSKIYRPSYVYNHLGIPSHVCYIVHTKDVPFLNFDMSKFKNNRNEALKENPEVPSKYYSSLKLVYISFSDIRRNQYLLSYRLIKILKYGTLSYLNLIKYDKNIDNLSPEISPNMSPKVSRENSGIEIDS